MTSKSVRDASSANTVVHGAVDDFDFLIGSWDVTMRRRRRILSDCDEWYDLRAVSTTQKIVGGLGIIDDVIMRTEQGQVVAMALRLFDPAARRWSIYWASTPSGVLGTPVTGGFEAGEGLFYGPDVHDGKPILARFRWRAGTAPHWEQAFSADGGHSWETNWTMDFERRATR